MEQFLKVLSQKRCMGGEVLRPCVLESSSLPLSLNESVGPVVLLGPSPASVSAEAFLCDRFLCSFKDFLSVKLEILSVLMSLGICFYLMFCPHLGLFGNLFFKAGHFS